METQPVSEKSVVVPFAERHLPAFIALNREWIEKHFCLEGTDLAQLESPYESILKPGGEIFFVLENDEAVGTCAMVPHGPGEYELAKMAVAPATRGKGYGDVLMRTCLAWAKEKGATSVTLLSNTVLEPAIALYLKHGFQVASLGTHADYERCNIVMVRSL
jgi:GNAT superfamily N-acetyltransferase